MLATSCSSTRVRTMKPDSPDIVTIAWPAVTVSPGCSGRSVSVVCVAIVCTTPANGATMRRRATWSAA